MMSHGEARPGVREAGRPRDREHAAGHGGLSDHGHTPVGADEAWRSVRDQMRERGLRWTPQRRILIETLAQVCGHVTGAELVEQCRRQDPETIPSTVYRTLDVLEELGLVRHCHGRDGREEYFVLPAFEHGHLLCTGCGATWALEAADAGDFVASIRESHGFEIDLSHVTIAGRCSACRQA